ncbi:MAG TPA: T9SS type A sorting domain-containing protein [Bacteroidales bacterium]|nr:T9SS type A sorting domain-containing protein [Bacteroidales bacterium]
MKRSILLVLFLALAAGRLLSQNLSLADSTGPLAQDATVVVAGNSASDELDSYVFVHNNSATATIAVKVKKVELHLTSGVINLFCWGLCFGPNVYVSTTTINILPGRTDSLDFSGHVSPNGNAGYTLMRYVFYNEADANDSVSFNVDYMHFPLSVTPVSGQDMISQAYPNPASGNVNFEVNVPSGSQGTLIIRNLLGSVVKEMDLPGSPEKIQVNTSGLQEGVYFYTLTLNGKPVVTRKLVIKH